jgi:hypothetical protein
VLGRARAVPSGARAFRESTFVPSETDFNAGGGGGQDRGRGEAAPTEPGRTQVFGTIYVVFEAR